MQTSPAPLATSLPSRARLAMLLVCPVCRGDLREDEGALVCRACPARWSRQNGVPVFLAEPAAVVSDDHQSNPLGPEFSALLAQNDGLTLHLGAGATTTRYANCVEFEHKIFQHTDVVEHLRDPPRAAAEILRVLRPGGVLFLHTAFLQALHEAPHHYYNATESGVRAWFADFEIERCEVSGNFGPGVMLGFLTATLLETLRQSEVPVADQLAIARTPLGDWADFWNRRGTPPPGFAALQSLPQELQARIAAGFELRARKSSVTA